MTIDVYLAELERALPWAPRLRRRLLVEVEDHLRSSAEAVGEDEAVARFGAPADVARGFHPAYARGYRAAAALALLAALVALFALLYPVPENTLPAAPWPEDAKPSTLAWKQDAMLLLFGAAVALGVLTAIVRRKTTWLTGATAAAIIACAGVGAALAIEWSAAVPGTPWLWLALGSAVPVVLALAATALVARAARLASAA